VSNRVNSIENFKWGNRKQDIDRFRIQVSVDTTNRNGAMTTNEPNSPDGMDELRECVDTLEQQIAEIETTGK